MVYVAVVLFPGIVVFKFLASCGMKHFDARIPFYLLVHGVFSIALGVLHG